MDILSISSSWEIPTSSLSNSGTLSSSAILGDIDMEVEQPVQKGKGKRLKDSQHGLSRQQRSHGDNEPVAGSSWQSDYFSDNDEPRPCLSRREQDSRPSSGPQPGPSTRPSATIRQSGKRKKINSKHYKR